MTGQVQQRIDLGDAHLLGTGRDLDDLLAGLHLTLGDDPQIEAGPVVCDQERRHPRLADAHPGAVAGDPRLGDFENRRADPVAITDADFVVGQPLDGEVLAEQPGFEVGAPELVRPVPI